MCIEIKDTDLTPGWHPSTLTCSALLAPTSLCISRPFSPSLSRDTMFSRVASTVARAVPVRAAAATHRFSSAAAAVTSQTSFQSFRLAVGAAAVAGGVILANNQRQEASPATCAAKAASFPYTGVPGTANERSFIVSRLLLDVVRQKASGPTLECWRTCDTHHVYSNQLLLPAYSSHTAHGTNARTGVRTCLSSSTITDRN